MTANSPGEKRRRATKRQRDRAKMDAELTALRSQGASCATCRSFEPAPFSIGGQGHICQRESDLQGYVRTTAFDLCTHYHARTIEGQ